MVNGESFSQNTDENDALIGDRVVSNTRANAFTELGTKIRELMEFVNPRHNVHGVIKEQLKARIATYTKAREKLETGKHNRDTTESATQTTRVTLLLNNDKGVGKGSQNNKLLSGHRESNREVTEEALKHKKSKGPQRPTQEKSLPQRKKLDEPTWTRVENKNRLEKRA
ncbi:unnamed protein product [Hermetia illucens]|uniref:Uncharacterized protein n=1 Tax=Hermetia illucens TaxID=343691 RepID=A0A7R8UUR5_HERIL|nr:unnamed protein product [Hermetia illucens]